MKQAECSASPESGDTSATKLPRCSVCGEQKAPRGVWISIECWAMCHEERGCPGYAQEPDARDHWPPPPTPTRTTPHAKSSGLIAIANNGSAHNQVHVAYAAGDSPAVVAERVRLALEVAWKDLDDG